MRPFLACFLLLLGSAATPAQEAARDDPLRAGLEAALRGCETWVLDPSSWIDGPAPFLAAMDLGDRIRETSSLPEALLPPEPLRGGNRYWRIAAGPEDGYALTVSSDVAMCHIAGGGGQDLQPAARAVATSPEFSGRWDREGEERRDGIVSTFFRSREEPRFTLVFSHAEAPGARRDRAQVLATAIYDPQR